MKKLMKRTLALVLAFTMCVSMLNLTAFAAGDAQTLQGEAHHFGGWSGNSHYSGGTLYLKTPATCDKPATYVYKCDTKHECNECATWVKGHWSGPVTWVKGHWEGGNEPCPAESDPIEVGTKLGHEFGDWYHGDPTHSVPEGKHAHTCSRCKFTEYADHETTTTGTAPTCTVKGNRVTACTVCGAVTANPSDDPLAHDFTGATWTSDGATGHHRDCVRTNCDYGEGYHQTAPHNGTPSGWRDVTGTAPAGAPSFDSATQKLQVQTTPCNDCAYVKTEYRVVNKSSKTFNVYHYEQGTMTEVAGTDSVTYLETDTGSNTFSAKTVTGFTPVDASASYTVSYAADATQSRIIYYTRNSYTVTVTTYVDGAQEEQPVVTNNVPFDSDFTYHPTTGMTGYAVEIEYTGATATTAKMPANNVVINVKYTCQHSNGLRSVPSTATCIAGGTAAHYECDTCHKLFTDAQGQNVTTVSALAAPALGHDYSTHAATGATDNGNGTHSWPCTRTENFPSEHPSLGGTEGHHYGDWVYNNDWTDVRDEDGVIRYQWQTATRTCPECLATQTADRTNTFGLENDLRRDKDSHTVTVTYEDGNGNPLSAATVTNNLLPGARYSAAPAEITGWSVTNGNLAVNNVQIGEDDVNITFIYTRNSYTLTINYVDGQGNPVAPQRTVTVVFEDDYSVVSPNVYGYHLVYGAQATVSGTMPADDVVVDVVYAANNPTLFIRYVYEDGTTAAASYYSVMTEGDSYNVASPSIEGYTPSRAVVSGTMSAGDAVFTVTYTADDVIIEETDPPLAETPDIPEEPSEPPEEVEMEDPDVPMAELPELPEPAEEVEIDEPDVPLASVPQTGDSTMLWTSAATISGVGLIWLAVDSRKRREDAE